MAKSKILFITLCSQGHINYCVTITRKCLELYGDQVEIHYAVNQEFADRLAKLVPEAKCHVYEVPEETASKGHNNFMVEMMQQFGSMWSANFLESLLVATPIFAQSFDSMKSSYADLAKIVDELQPNFIIFDHLFSMPVGKDRGIPWANLFSAAMSFCGLPGMPAPQSGLPSAHTPENEKLWNEFIDKAYRTGAWAELKNKVNGHLVEKGVKPIPDEEFMCVQISPHLNIYAYPKELDYSEQPTVSLPGPGAWLRIDTPVLRPFPAPYPVPEKLKNKPGKLIYFSLGSMATAYRPLMIKMIEILSELPHRFILSKGIIGEEYSAIMGDNMEGENFVDQLAVLQTVEMIISHGGNNTLTESFNFGVPLIILPLFGDQPDNAQRVQDMGYGRRLSIFDEKEKLKADLVDAIAFCSSEPVVQKLKRASERIQKDSGVARVCEELLKLSKQ